MITPSTPPHFQKCGRLLSQPPKDRRPVSDRVSKGVLNVLKSDVIIVNNHHK